MKEIEKIWTPFLIFINIYYMLVIPKHTYSKKNVII